MNAIDLLTQRSSMPRLIEPGPSVEHYELMQKAALRAPDHVQLQPYRFVHFYGAGLQQLSDIFVAAAKQRGDDEEAQQRISEAPFRAPSVIACIMTYKAHEKVPRVEQLCTAACATMAMQQAAFAQGLGAIWRSGWLTQSEYIKARLQLGNEDELLGFLYVGTPFVPTPIKPDKPKQGIFSEVTSAD